MTERPGTLTVDEAERIAIGGLAFLADRPDDLSRFLALSGIGPANLRTAAADRGFLAGIIDHFLGNEPLLIAFARSAGVAPESLAEAGRLLAGR